MGAYRDEHEEAMERHESMRDREYLEEQRLDRLDDYAPAPRRVSLNDGTVPVMVRHWVEPEDRTLIDAIQRAEREGDPPLALDDEDVLRTAARRGLRAMAESRGFEVPA